MALTQRPAIFAAIVTAAATVGVALAGALGGGISAYYQNQSDRAHLKVTMLLAIVQTGKAERKEQARTLIKSGLLKDDDGAICRAFIEDGC